MGGPGGTAKLLAGFARGKIESGSNKKNDLTARLHRWEISVYIVIETNCPGGVSAIHLRKDRK